MPRLQIYVPNDLFAAMKDTPGVVWRDVVKDAIQKEIAWRARRKQIADNSKEGINAPASSPCKQSSDRL